MEIYIINYIVVISIFLLINAFIAGYNGTNYTKNEIINSIFWPVTLMSLIGRLIKAIVLSLKIEKEVKK